MASKKVNIGELDTKVGLYSLKLTTGSKGEKVKTYEKHSDVFARIDRNTQESVNDYNLESGASLLVTIYKVAGLTTRWRVRVEGKDYEVISVDPIERQSQFCTLGLNAIE